MNDFCDSELDSRGTRKIFFGIPLSGGSGALQANDYNKHFVLILAIGCATFGLSLALLCSSSVGLIYVAGLVLATSYSAKPIRLKDRGPLAYIAHLLGYGPVCFYLGFLSVASSITFHSVPDSLVIGLWTATVGLTADLLDYDDDKRNDVGTLVVRCGRTRSTFAILLIVAGVLGIVVSRSTPLLWPLTLTLILATVIYGVAVWFHRRSSLPPWVHAVALFLEVMFPFYVIYDR
jgi:1,4-dihydroxy-2-naphthoate octaprenyltransferase